MTATFTVYAVYKDNEIKAGGSLLACWRWLMTEYADQIAVNPNYLAHDLAESGVHIAPVGDRHAKAA